MFFLPTSAKEAKAQLADWSAHVLKDKRDQPKVMYHGTNNETSNGFFKRPYLQYNL